MLKAMIEEFKESQNKIMGEEQNILMRQLSEEKKKSEESEEESGKEEKSEIPNLLENADENSEIDDSLESDNSENGEETAPVNDETLINEKAVNLKELLIKSLETYCDNKFETMKNSFNDELSKKDLEIKSLRESLGKTQKILESFL